MNRFVRPFGLTRSTVAACIVAVMGNLANRTRWDWLPVAVSVALAEQSPVRPPMPWFAMTGLMIGAA
jgi:hypothetical protein